jgi:hypothetical protein
MSRSHALQTRHSVSRLRASAMCLRSSAWPHFPPYCNTRCFTACSRWFSAALFAVKTSRRVSCRRHLASTSRRKSRGRDWKRLAVGIEAGRATALAAHPASSSSSSILIRHGSISHPRTLVVLPLCTPSLTFVAPPSGFGLRGAADSGPTPGLCVLQTAESYIAKLGFAPCRKFSPSSRVPHQSPANVLALWSMCLLE